METTSESKPLGDSTVACKKSTTSGVPDEPERTSIVIWEAKASDDRRDWAEGRIGVLMLKDRMDLFVTYTCADHE